MADPSSIRPFLIDPGWSKLLAQHGLRAADVLRRADVPEDLFARNRPSLEAERYLRLWRAMAAALGTDAPGITLGRAELATSPMQLAGLCSANLTAALTRVSRFKSLTGPIGLELHDTIGGLEVTIQADGVDLPAELIVAEMVGLVEIARLGLCEAVRPIAVELKTPPSQPGYREYFGRALRPGPFDRVVFTAEMAKRAFLPPDPALFTDYDADLRPRLDALAPAAPMAARVVSLLMETLPAGHADVALIAQRLGLSSRSLQRRLRSEGTGFKDVLQTLRTRLAGHYIEKTFLTNAQIAFLLAYDDPNSFIRAFHGWTGSTPEAMRQQLTDR